MIFYFSATGNSKYVAQRIAEATGERLISLSDAVRQRRWRYELAWDEPIGFVTPIYFAGLPSIIHFFLGKLSLQNVREQYVYLVQTCGSLTGDTAGQFSKLLKKKGLTLSAQFGIPMVDNYIPVFTVADQETQHQILDAAEAHIDDAIRAIRARGIGDYNRFRGHAPELLTAVGYQAYAHHRPTKPFLVTDACISCGLCQEVCPCGAITLIDGKPQWSKKQCVHCFGCLHRCPTEAIRWKDPDEARGRYYNPRVKP